jgi:hypothetical protein
VSSLSKKVVFHFYHPPPQKNKSHLLILLTQVHVFFLNRKSKDLDPQFSVERSYDNEDSAGRDRSGFSKIRTFVVFLPSMLRSMSHAGLCHFSLRHTLPRAGTSFHTSLFELCRTQLLCILSPRGYTYGSCWRFLRSCNLNANMHCSIIPQTGTSIARRTIAFSFLASQSN